MVNQQCVCVVSFCLVGKIVGIKMFVFQGNKQAVWCQFLGISGYSIKGDICILQFIVENVGKLVKGYVNYVIIFSRCVIVM